MTCFGYYKGLLLQALVSPVMQLNNVTGSWWLVLLPAAVKDSLRGLSTASLVVSVMLDGSLETCWAMHWIHVCKPPPAHWHPGTWHFAHTLENTTGIRSIWCPGITRGARRGNMVQEGGCSFHVPSISPSYPHSYPSHPHPPSWGGSHHRSGLEGHLCGQHVSAFWSPAWCFGLLLWEVKCEQLQPEMMKADSYS